MDKYIEPKFNDKGYLKPQWLLPPSFVGDFAVPICFSFGLGVWLSVGVFLLFNLVMNYLSDAYLEYAASVLAGNDSIRPLFGAGFTPSQLKCTTGRVSTGLLYYLVSWLLHSIPIPLLLFEICLRSVPPTADMLPTLSNMVKRSDTRANMLESGLRYPVKHL